MTHLTDDQFNEILDGTIFDNSITRHLEACADCQTRLDDLRAVFSMLESIPEVQPPRDLTASVMAKLSPAWGGMPHRTRRVIRPTKTWTWLSVAQAIGALAIFAWLASSFTLPPEIAAYQPPTFDTLLASILSMLSSISFEIDLSSFIFQPSSLDLQSTTILMFIVSAVVLWLVGNGLLLRTPQRNNK